MLILGSLLWRTTGQGAPPPPPPPDINPVIPSGGFPARERSRKEISDARARLGLKDKYAAEAIALVAAQQVARLEQDKQKQLDELRGELKLRNLEIEAGYLEALAAERERLMDAEIATRIAERLRVLADEELMLFMMIAAGSVA